VRLVRTRNPGAAIVEEARERRSDLIYISTEHAPSEEKLLGPTTRYVLAKRPCRVIVEKEGGDGRSPPVDSGSALNGVGEPIAVP
jgi:nucleotide-binding universal stress UspA family protein